MACKSLLGRLRRGPVTLAAAGPTHVWRLQPAGCKSQCLLRPVDLESLCILIIATVTLSEPSSHAELERTVQLTQVRFVAIVQRIRKALHGQA